MRYGSTPMGTFGKMVHDAGWFCYTVERPWKQNAPSVSCVPAGLYPMVRGVFPKHPFPVYQLQNVPKRAGIEIHPANTMDQLEGCIAPGKEFGWMDPYWAVLDSRVAFSELMDLPLVEEIFITWQPIEPD